MKNPTRLTLWIAMLALAAAPAFAEDVVYSGADHWSTARTFAHFVQDPLPADFFCPGSAPFADRIDLKGVPLATRPECILGNVDTIVHRIDDATFQADGSASTRIRFLALSLAGIEPLEIPGCGVYDVSASLDGDQPTTEMKIFRTAENGGIFKALLNLNVKMVFSPQDGGEPLQVRRNIQLGPGTSSVWSIVPMPKHEEIVRVQVDTDGDRVPDTMIPAATNFAAGNINPNVVPAAVTQPSPDDELCYTTNPPAVECPEGLCPYQSCHCTLDSTDPFEPLNNCRSGTGPGGISICHLHCTNVCIECGPEEEPTQQSL